ncbi:MAG: hypothetical protein ACFFD4_30835 [Candidatus Odinarchaeota archaeon]
MGLLEVFWIGFEHGPIIWKNPEPGDNSSSEPKKHVHAILSPERAEKFRVVKSLLGLKSDVEALRKCIDEMHESLQGEKIKLRPVLEQQVNLLLNNSFLKRRHLVLTQNDVVNEAVHQWIQNKMSEINLHHFPFRKELSVDEQKVALVFVEKQYSTSTGSGITFEQLMGYLEGMEEPKVHAVLGNFLSNGLVLKNRLDGIDYYHAPVP